ncbi:MAG: hypothetical protein ACC662_02030 [Planctomycetota bacterium]
MAIVLIDPLDNLPISLALDRAPILEDFRYTFPALARKKRFDSAVVGSSTSRLFQPKQLDRLFDARFVNLSMNNASDYEQSLILGIFLDHHRRPRVVIFGLDEKWLQPADAYQAKSTLPGFPAWLYDDDPWNDFAHVFDPWMLEKARRQLSQVLGIRRATYARDGSWRPPPGWGRTTPEKRRRLLYGEGPIARRPVEPPVVLGEAERRALVFPAHAALASLLGRLPEGTEKVLFLAPYFLARQPGSGSREAAVAVEAKARIATLVGATPRARLLDFMIPSPLTRDEANYVDGVHVTPEATARVADLLAASRAPGLRSPLFVRLTR